MADEEKLEENKEEEQKLEVKSETVKEEKKEETEKKVEYKRTDYQYKSCSRGAPVPEGWERCPGYPDVIRRLKPELLQPKEPIVEAKAEGASKKEELATETEKKEAADEVTPKKDTRG
jgi:hypothetical protein